MSFSPSPSAGGANLTRQVMHHWATTLLYILCILTWDHSTLIFSVIIGREGFIIATFFFVFCPICHYFVPLFFYVIFLIDMLSFLHFIFFFLIYFFILLFETGSYYVPLLCTRMALNSWSSCLYLLSTRIINV